MFPYQLIFGKAYHLPVEMEHRVLWAIKQLSFNLNKASELRKHQISKFEEIRNKAYAKIAKCKAKIFHDKTISRKKFIPRQKSFSTTLGFIIFRKVEIQMDRAIHDKTVFPCSAIEIGDSKNGSSFKVNGQCIKLFLKFMPDIQEEFVKGLFDPFSE